MNHVARFGRHFRLVATRARLRLAKRPVVALLSGAGDDNFGDEVMFEVLRSGLPGCRLAPVMHPATEHRLARIGLSGSSIFSGVILGGGTLINPYFFARLTPVMPPGMSVWSVGTGVGSAGFGSDEPELGGVGWAEPLSRFRRITVRGPNSAEFLVASGFTGVDIVGDLALAATPDEPLPRASDKRILVNLAGDDRMPRDREMTATALEGLANGLTRLARDGWILRPIAMHRADLPLLAQLGDRVGGWSEPTGWVRDASGAFSHLRAARCLVAVRLHAATFGWMSGVPTLALGYRDKTADLAKHLGVDDQVVDLATTSPRKIEEAALALAARPWSSAAGAHRRALAARDQISKLLSDIESEILTPR